MMQQRYGNIVNIASIYGMLGPDLVSMRYNDYASRICGNKGAIISFTRYLATYLAPYNIRVNCLSPGYLMNNLKRLLKNIIKKLMEEWVTWRTLLGVLFC